VSAQSIPKLFTVEEYEQIPDPPGGRYELHHGELVFVTYPVRQHGDLQHRLQKHLSPAAEKLGFLVRIEYPYRPLPESEVWGADVACVRKKRHRAVEKWLLGSPELVIEVKSPSNTYGELHDKAMTTLAGDGAVEFWIVDPKSATVKVYSKSAGVHIYTQGAAPVPGLDFDLSLETLFADDDDPDDIY
jgi:Uma2 family endonuclease